MLRPAVAATNWASAEISGLDMREGGSVVAFAVPVGTSLPKCPPGPRPSTTGAGRGKWGDVGGVRQPAEPLPEMRRLVVAAAAAQEQQDHQADADDEGKSRPQREGHIAFRRDRLAFDRHR